MNLLMGIPSTDHMELAQYEIEGFRELGIVVDTISYGSRSRIESKLTKIFVVLRTIFEIRRALRRKKYDLLYLNSAFAMRGLIRDVATCLGLCGTGVPIYIKMHGSESALLKRQDFYVRSLRRILFRRVSAFGLLSSEEVTNFCNAGAMPNKLFQVKNVVNPSVYKRDFQFRENLGLDPHTPMILFVSRLIPSKGLIDLIHACGIIRDRGYIFDLICLGDGPELAGCAAATRDLKLEEHVQFLGYLPESETKAFYANADMVILPTWHDEGFPMAVFQAVAAGVPVITTRIRAAADYLREPDNCLWVEPKNSSMLAEKIQQLLDDEALASQMGRNNSSSAVNYSKETVAREFVESYQKAIGISPPRSP